MAHPDKPHLDRVPKRWNPSVWASKVPFGLTTPHPNNFAEITRAMRENKDELPYAWRILNQGVCDGCALGVAGLRDWTTDGPHLCNIRLRLLRLNTMPGFDPRLLADVTPLRNQKSAKLRELGRIPYPMMREKGDPGFRRITWDVALDTIAGRIKTSSPDRIGFYLTGRGTVNETYYAAQKAVRAMGTNSIDNAARICHAPSSVALKDTLGVGATTCGYGDWIGTDLLVFIGSNPANNQPVTTKYLHYAKKAGTKVVLVNTYREPGMERYWVPSIPESALFGTKIADDTVLITQGGDIAFLSGALKHIFERDLVDHDFIATHTTGFDALKASIEAMSWSTLEEGSGVSEAEMRAFGQLVGTAKTAVFVWSMGITQHTNGEANVRAIVDLALTRGFVGRDMCGLMPIRGHSGIQGGAEMGAYSTAFPGNIKITPESAAALSEQWGFTVPDRPGMITSEMIDAADQGELDVLFAAGSNFLEVLPDPAYIDQALGKIPLRVHQDIVLTSQMFIDPADTVILLPAATRYETPGGVTQRSTERRVMFSPEIEGRRIGEARPEWEIFLDLARRVRPDLRMQLTYPSTQQVREEIARIVPLYDGIQRLHKTGDQFQAGGKHLCENWVFPTEDGKAHFFPVPLPEREIPAGTFAVATRRGKQFNSMIHDQKDAITNSMRDAVFMNARDAKELGLADGDAVLLHNSSGELRGRVQIVPIARRNLQVMWPEGNVLLDRHKRSPESGVPDYNAYVTVERDQASSLAAD
ncbi:MAG: FdhF/YdeP family oxidoreductase [Thermomicrobiales bacterium]|nr:FdhF/YdeP family oxidoreductase [Thermomicrobiales bacterium]